MRHSLEWREAGQVNFRPEISKLELKCSTPREHKMPRCVLVLVAAAPVFGRGVWPVQQNLSKVCLQLEFDIGIQVLISSIESNVPRMRDIGLKLLNLVYLDAS